MEPRYIERLLQLIKNNHLIVKQNKIKFKKCNENNQVKDNEFRSNEALKNSIEIVLFK